MLMKVVKKNSGQETLLDNTRKNKIDYFELDQVLSP